MSLVVPGHSKFYALLCLNISLLSERRTQTIIVVNYNFFYCIINVNYRTSMDQLIGKFSTFMIRNKHTLPDLSYDYGELEPVLSAEIMKIHHQKHHAAYVNNLNIAEEKVQESLAKGQTSNFFSKIIFINFFINFSVFKF